MQIHPQWIEASTLLVRWLAAGRGIREPGVGTCQFYVNDGSQQQIDYELVPETC